MKSRTGFWMVVLGSLLLVIVAVFFILPRLQEFWQAPLGPELGFDEQPVYTQVIPSATFTLTNPPLPTTGETSIPPTLTLTPTSDLTPIAFPTYTPSRICSEQTEMLFLAIGLDNRVEGFSTYGRADVIKIVKIDFLTPSVSVLSFPRDLWVQLPNTTEEVTESKLNQSYFYGMPGMGIYNGPGGGAGLLARTLAYNYGVQPDHYGTVNISILEDIIDAIGGVDIYLEQTLDARDSPESDDLWKIYEAGWNHLDGKRAVYYARIRKTDDVFGRMDRQTEILCAIKTQILKPSAIMGIPDMISAFIDNVSTDLSPAQLAELACVAPFLEPQNITFARFPEDELHGMMIESPNLNGKEFIWDIDQNRIRNYVTWFLEGTWPPPPNADEPASAHNGETQMLCPEYPARPDG